MTTTTLFGGRLVTVVYELTEAELKQPDPKPRTEEVRVRQLKTPDYEFGFTVIADEFALTAFCVSPSSSSSTSTGRDKAWVLSVTPESYEQLRAAAQEVNDCFFAFAARREKFLREQQERQIAAMANMPPEVLKMAHDLGARSLSPNMLPGPRPRPA